MAAKRTLGREIPTVIFSAKQALARCQLAVRAPVGRFLVGSWVFVVLVGNESKSFETIFARRDLCWCVRDSNQIHLPAF